MHHRHVALGALLVDGDGWQRPARYAAVDQEVRQVQDAAGLCDISPAGKLTLQGRELDAWLSEAFSSMGGVDVGAVRRGDAGMDSDPQPVLLARLADDEFFILTEPNHAGSVAESLGAMSDRGFHLVDVSSGLAGVKIAGPAASLVLAGVTELDLAVDAFPDMSCAQAGFAEVHGTLLRIDRGALPGYELYFGREYGEYMWDALLEAGDEGQVAPVGIEAMARLQGGE